MEKNASVAGQIERIRSFGVGISMDDFGTGYSSLSYLLSYPFTKIKIDKSFVLNMREAANSRLVIAAIVNLGRSLGLTVTAEGIEEQEDLDLLRSLGCEQGQGYLIGRAAPSEALVPAERYRQAS
jgi:EAL domain-containing protein (putative c-di-GMP-specific phosphodiesterase class I)